MAREQVQYRGSSEELRTVQAPNIAAVQARFDPRSSKAFALAEVLGASSTAAVIDKLSQRVNEDEEKRAESFASSMTVEELGRAVRNGEVLASKSPIFRATVEHIYGENLASKLQSQINSRLEAGETFGAPREIDEYLVKTRTDLLGGQSQYAVAGFDKSFNKIRQQAVAANERAVSKKLEERAVALATDKFSEIYKNQDPNVSAEQRVENIVQNWQVFRRDGLLGNTERQREIMMNVLTQAAQNKDTGFLDRMLDQKLSDGITVRSFIKPDKAIALYKMVDSVETAEYYRDLRAKNQATDDLEQAVVETLAAGGNPKALEKDPRFSVLNDNDRMVKIEQVANNWRKFNGVEQPFDDSRKQFIRSQLEGIDDPDEAQSTKFTLLASAGSSLEKQFIREVFNNGKFKDPSADPGFRFGKGIVQSAHKSTDFFIGSDTYGPAFRSYQQAWQSSWYLSGKDLYEQHKDIIPEAYQDRPLARLPLEIKNKLAEKIAKPFLGIGAAPAGSPGGVAESSRPANPNSDRTLNKGEAVSQGGITIKKTD